MPLRGAFYLAGPLDPWLAGLLAAEFPSWRRQVIGGERPEGFVRFRSSPRGAKRLVALARKVPLALLVGGRQVPKAKAWLLFTRRAGLNVFVPEDPRVEANCAEYDFFVYSASALSRPGPLPFMPPAVAAGFRGAGIYDRRGELVLPDPTGAPPSHPSEAAPFRPSGAAAPAGPSGPAGPAASGGGGSWARPPPPPVDWSIEAVSSRNAASGAVVSPPEGVNPLLWNAFMGPELPSRARFSPPQSLISELRKFNGSTDPFIGLYTEKLTENFPTSLDVPSWYRPAFGGIGGGSSSEPGASASAPASGEAHPVASKGQTSILSSVLGFFGARPPPGKPAPQKKAGGFKRFIQIASYCCLILFLVYFARAAFRGFRSTDGDVTIKTLSGGALGVKKTAGAVVAMIRGPS